MNRNDNGHAASGIELLTITFIVLKLCKVIDWPWVWVLSPIWIVVALILILAAIRVIMRDRRNRSDDGNI